MNLRIFFCCKIYEFKNVLVSGWVRSFFILQCVDWPMIMIFTALSGMSTLHIARKMQKKLFVKNQHWGRGEACRKSNIEERWRNSNSKSIIFWQPCVTLRAPKDTRALRFCWRLRTGLVDGRKPSIETLCDGQKPSVETQSASFQKLALCVFIEGLGPRRRPKAFSKNAKRAPKDTLWPSTRPEAFIRNAKRAYLSARALRFYWRFLSVDEARSLQ